MTTFLNIPPEGGDGSPYWEDAVVNFAALPTGTVNGEVRMTNDTRELYYWDSGDSMWKPVPTGAISSGDVDDTESISLTVTAGVLTADINISSDAADANYILGEVDVQPDPSPGLRVQVANSLIRGLLSASDAYIVYNATTGDFTLSVADVRTIVSSGDAYIDYNSSTGVFTLSVADVLALFSSTTSAIDYDNTTGEFTFVPGNVDHGDLADLSADTHLQYLLLQGRAGGQTAIGGTASGDDLTLSSTADSTKGNVIVQDPLQLPVRTTVQIAGLTPSPGLVVYDSDTDRPMIYVAGTTNDWVPMIGWGS
jgi:hypothetical protein